MKRFCEIMVIAYIILFIPVSVVSSTFDLFAQVGAEYVNKFIVSSVSFVVNLMPLLIFASAGFGYAMNKNEKYNISLPILMVPLAAFVYVWLGIMFA